MGLKQSIVIVNEYTIKTGTKGGSRGGTPGDYVLRYMARDGATEDLTPVRLEDTDEYITRYMARKEASEVMDDIGKIKKGMRDAQGLGGVAFGNDDISMSHHKVKAVSRDIQKQFDDGKTVMKTVISFEEDYLRRYGVISPDFTFEKRGDYRGNIDQMKLRKAITDGMNKMSRNYDDLEWIGVIQVDTAHVHCHLCMVDKGVGNLAKDGTQKGKISEKSKRVFRRAADMSLDDMNPVRYLSSNITHDKRNVKCYIKRFAHRTMAEHGTPQLLMACLPDDKRLWRAGTNRKEMKKANAIVREYTIQVLNQPDSGYREALREIDEYAAARRKRESLTGKEYRRLIDNGKEQLIEDCMNGVYSVLKQIPDEDRYVHTPMLDIMSMDYDIMASETETDPMVEFGFKLRSYSSRLDHHRKERHKYHENRKLYEDAKAHDEVSPESQPLYDFYCFEEEYNAKLMSKYQHFLAFLPAREEYEEDFKKVLDYNDKLKRMKLMKEDKMMKRMGENSAEDYGQRVYDMHGGRYAVTNPTVLDNRYEAMQNTYNDMVSDFRYKLADNGLSFDTSDDTNLKVSKERPYPFSEVKALDIHHLGYDFPFDTEISYNNIQAFIECADERHDKCQEAFSYLVLSGQREAVSQLPMKDVTAMKEMADMLRSKPILPSNKTSPLGVKHKARTVGLDMDYDKVMQATVKATVQSITFGED